MNIADKILDIISMLEDSISYEDWKGVDEAKKELSYIYEELESSFPLDDSFDDEY
jgi:hypothetical protein